MTQHRRTQHRAFPEVCEEGYSRWTFVGAEPSNRGRAKQPPWRYRPLVSHLSHTKPLSGCLIWARSSKHRRPSPGAGQHGPAEWQARLELAATYRLVELYGWTSIVYNHITLRVPVRMTS